jgi:voltage-gated potassium channel
VHRQPLARLISHILFGKGRLTVTRAAFAIGTVTLFVTVAGAVVIRFADRKDFPSIWLGIWWALQTLTTVGYGDIVPHGAFGKVVGSVVMLVGIALVAVFTAVITAAFVENARRRRGEDTLLQAMETLSQRIDTLERTLTDGSSPRVAPAAGDQLSPRSPP